MTELAVALVSSLMFFKTYLHLICGEDFIELLSPKK